MYLIMYDINNNSRRVWLANKLIELGFERLQKSVYLGLDTPLHLAEVRKFLSQINVDMDSVIVINLSKSSIRNMVSYGKFDHDIDWLCGETRSLII